MRQPREDTGSGKLEFPVDVPVAEVEMAAIQLGGPGNIAVVRRTPFATSRSFELVPRHPGIDIAEIAEQIQRRVGLVS